jgi:hypothetical protein
MNVRTRRLRSREKLARQRATASLTGLHTEARRASVEFCEVLSNLLLSQQAEAVLEVVHSLTNLRLDGRATVAFVE